MPDLLFLTDVSPYRHQAQRDLMAGVHQSLGSAAVAVAEIAGMNGLGFRHAARAGDLTTADLRAARLLVLYTIGETPWTSEQRAVIEERARAGALGVVGLHSASDAAYGWPAMGELLGARFSGHPITGELPVTVVDRDHPATAHLASPWRFHDELYLFRDLMPDARILLAVELGDPPGAVRLPLAWCRDQPPMRTFYTSLGHFVAAYEDARYLQHIRGGIEWVLAAERPPGQGTAFTRAV